MYSQCRPLWASPNKGMGVGLSYCGRVYASLNVHHISIYIYIQTRQIVANTFVLDANPLTAAHYVTGCTGVTGVAMAFTDH